MRQISIVIFLIFFLISCAGVRRGIESRVVDNFSSNQIVLNRHGEFIGWGRWLDQIKFPGISMVFKLNNTVVTSEITHAIIPVTYEKKGIPDHYTWDEYVIELKVSPTIKGFNLHWKNIILSINGINIRPTKVRYDILEIEGFETQQVPNDILNLAEVNKQYELYVHFNNATPTPDLDIQLDLSEALVNDQLPPIPIIYFEKIGFLKIFHKLIIKI